MSLLMQAGGDKYSGAEEKEEENRAECHFSNKYTAGVVQQTKKEASEDQSNVELCGFDAAGGVSEATVEWMLANFPVKNCLLLDTNAYFGINRMGSETHNAITQ